MVPKISALKGSEGCRGNRGINPPCFLITFLKFTYMGHKSVAQQRAALAGQFVFCLQLLMGTVLTEDSLASDSHRVGMGYVD